MTQNTLKTPRNTPFIPTTPPTALGSAPFVALRALCVLCLLALPLLSGTPAQGAPSAQSGDSQQKPSPVPGYSLGRLRSLYDQVHKTGLGFDAIQALSSPQFVTVSDASLSMEDDEIVFLVTFPEGLTRIYPQRIMVWHEVINDALPDNQTSRSTTYTGKERADGRYTITYSPLSGTVVAFRSLAGQFPSTFGVTGDLINANSILYDRISQSLWSQLLAASFDGPLQGKRLERIPVLRATWKGVKKRYMGRAEVLSRSTGFKRAYGSDPYGSYQRTGNYYDDTRMVAPLSSLDKRLHPKKRILGIEYEGALGALVVDEVRKVKVLNFFMGITPLVALYDEELDAVRVFDRRIGAKRGEKPLEFLLFEGMFTDTESRSKWTAEGTGTYGKYRDTKLVPVFTIDSMWMSWSAFHKNTPIFPQPDQPGQIRF